MWRVDLIIVSVVVLDMFLFVAIWTFTATGTDKEITRTLAAHSDHPTVENKRAFDTAFRKGEFRDLKIRAAASIVILAITAGGFFFAGRQFERYKAQARTSTSPVHARSHI